MSCSIGCLVKTHTHLKQPVTSPLEWSTQRTASTRRGESIRRPTLNPVRSGTSRTIFFSSCTIYLPTPISTSKELSTVLGMSSCRSAAVSLVILAIATLRRQRSILRKGSAQRELVEPQLAMILSKSFPTAPTMGFSVDLPSTFRKEFMVTDY